MKPTTKHFLALTYLGLVTFSGQLWWLTHPPRSLNSDDYYQLLDNMPRNLHLPEAIELHVQRALKKQAGNPSALAEVTKAAEVIRDPYTREAYDYLTGRGLWLRDRTNSTKPEAEDYFQRLGLDPSVGDPEVFKIAFYQGLIENAGDPWKLVRIGEAFQVLKAPEKRRLQRQALASGALSETDTKAAELLTKYAQSDDLKMLLEEGAHLFDYPGGTLRLNLIRRYWRQVGKALPGWTRRGGDRETLVALAARLAKTSAFLAQQAPEIAKGPEAVELSSLSWDFAGHLHATRPRDFVETRGAVPGAVDGADPNPSRTSLFRLSETCRKALRWLSGKTKSKT